MSRPRKSPPRRRPEVPLARPGAQNQTPPSMGVPLAQALHCSVADLQQSTQDVTTVAQGMTLPATDVAVQTFSGRPFAGQHELSYLVAGAVSKVKEVAARSQVQPDVLLGLRRKLDVTSRARRTTVQGQNLAADGRLLLRSKFSFYFKLLIDRYQAKLADESRPLAERMQLAQDFARVDGIYFRSLAQKADALAQTSKDKKALSGQVQDQLDENAFFEARQVLDKGGQPDLATLQRAQRHAQRLQVQTDQAAARSDRRHGAR